MSGGHPQRKLLRLAWVLPVFILLCGLQQLGWLDLTRLEAAVSSAVGNSPVWPLVTPLVRRHAAQESTSKSLPDIQTVTSSQGGRTLGANSSGGRDTIDGGNIMQCDGPFDVPKVRIAEMMLTLCIPGFS